MFALIFLISCKSQPAVTDQQALVKRGSSIYQTACISCHSFDAAGVGPIGPPVMGASRLLLETKILRGEYPAGYTPKRETKIMVPMPHLKKEIDALTAYLNPAKLSN